MLVVGLLLAVSTGCFSERAFPIAPEQVRFAVHAADSPPADTRGWLTATQAQLAGLLPAEDIPPLLTDDLADQRGVAVDVLGHFDRSARTQQSVWLNFYGLLHTAQATGAPAAIDQRPPPWPGFEDVWVPVRPGLELSARLGLARGSDGLAARADCIVIVPGLLGDNGVRRTRDLGAMLLERGLHVLALELPGFGQTERRYPDVLYTFGVRETGDLLSVAAWLEEQPFVRRTGLIGFCWGANQALLAAWEDGRQPDDPDVAPRLAEQLRPLEETPRFSAGVVAFSPVVDFESLIARLDQEANPLVAPVYAALQAGVRERKQRKGHPDQTGSLRTLIEYEMAGAPGAYAGRVDDGGRYLRWLPGPGRPVGDKLAAVRTPTLVVHASNDPLADPRAVAQLIARSGNPHVAAIMLDGGGHCGFGPYASEYFYSLIASFFDPVHGAAAVTGRRE